MLLTHPSGYLPENYSKGYTFLAPGSTTLYIRSNLGGVEYTFLLFTLTWSILVYELQACVKWDTEVMEPEKLKLLPLHLRFKWHVLFAWLMFAAAAAAVAALIFGRFRGYLEPEVIVLWVLSAVAFFAGLVVSVFALLLLTQKNVQAIKNSSEKLETASGMIERSYELIGRLIKTACLSDAAKQIVFADIEKTELQNAVLLALHQQKFDLTDAMIKEISRRTEYRDIAEELRSVADDYRYATEDEQINQTIAHIDKLCEQYDWTQAGAEVERLRKAFPYSAKAEAIGDKFYEARDKRKADLLAIWDKAVRNQQTDRSLEVLRELDMYLTPNEGLALQESASSVFKTKLHALGVEFSVAVTEKKWANALEIGSEIVQNFPNSRMAREIRDKMDVLQEKTGRKTPANQ